MLMSGDIKNYGGLIGDIIYLIPLKTILFCFGSIVKMCLLCVFI